MAPLFGPDVPPGFSYCADFVTAATETALLAAIAQVTFSTFEMRGVVARRRVAFFGASYSERPAAPIPEFLLPIRGAVAEWTHLAPDAFAMALINEFPPGAPIGWHRDASQYDVVAGLSLLSACEMRFRPYARSGAAPAGERRRATHAITLERRSAYLIAGDARSRFEHHIPPVPSLRYSITFRTLRALSSPAR